MTNKLSFLFINSLISCPLAHGDDNFNVACRSTESALPDNKLINKRECHNDFCFSLLSSVPHMEVNAVAGISMRQTKKIDEDLNI